MGDFSEIRTLICRLGCAVIAGGVLGWEREVHEKPAGLRTNMMVSLGAALLVLVGEHLAQSRAAGDPVREEVARIIQGIVGGIGFLGAGAILQSRHHVRGLTTASTIWLSAGLGVASGLGYYVLTLVAVGFGIVVLIVFGSLESRWMKDEEDSRPPR